MPHPFDFGNSPKAGPGSLSGDDGFHDHAERILSPLPEPPISHNPESLQSTLHYFWSQGSLPPLDTQAIVEAIINDPEAFYFLNNLGDLGQWQIEGLDPLLNYLIGGDG